jgi:phosphatidate cytidylyltransferase
MLRQRVFTALALLALLVPALWANQPAYFALLTLVFIGAGGWEWARLNGLNAAAAVASGLTVAASCALLWLACPIERWPGGALWWSLTLAWLLGAGWLLSKGPAQWFQLPLALRLAAGFFMLTGAWMALSVARARGLNFILSTLCVVWMADIAAYFGGRAFGRRKLAPSISPGKSWEGVVAGVLGVMVLAGAWNAFESGGTASADSLFRVIQRGPLYGFGAGWALCLLLLCALSVIGDLLESLVKRAAGAKDSSGLLPGHGGVLDRLDALLPVLPAALALASA